ncbi:leucine--tRNA ligase [Halobacteriales archaeon SW_7_68_16]|nr:MAG: leucine--tRNA ligase [Halobacteriales archaeon SW_7_68_16]
MDEYDPRGVEEKWRSRWREAGTYEADPDDREATFVTVPYPYPSGGMHIGHARTYTVPDVHARYRRLQGDNVLFPMAWHVTGTPIVGAVERLQNRDEDQLSVLQGTYGVPDDALSDLETPMGFARYFIEESYKPGMQRLGVSVDWRREFTTDDERYQRFVEWQYRTLRERGLLEKGLHPVKYCTNEANPVTTHDLLEGEEAEFQEYTLVRFAGEDAIFPMATLRPETVRGVTNAYVDPDATYVRAAVDGETWIVSEAAAEKLRLQAHEVTVRERSDGADLVGERVENPVTGDELPILPAAFVDADNATGVVMSVPGHSPDDWIALEEAKADPDRMRAYGVDPEAVAAIEPISVIDVEGYGEFPARDAVEEYEVESSSDPALEEATGEVYEREFHHGRLREGYGTFTGEVIEDVREELRASFRERGAFGSMYEFSERVVCRCGGDVEVAEQETWFLRYDDEDWKERAREVIAQLDAIPENTREQYDHAVDWLQEWPCIRNYGLGTRLPWDDEFVIEPLSDSTLYMGYYTVAPHLRDVPVEEFDDDFFDTLFLGPEAADDPHPEAERLREEFEYWYPVDYRCSGNDLINNHLTFYQFHHGEFYDRENWPQGITIMGMGLLEGEKMSSSKGHVVLPDEAIDEFGADTVRFYLLNSAEPWQDYDWRDDQVASTRDSLRRFWRRSLEVVDADAPEERPDLERIDRWLLGQLNGTIEAATEALESFETRTASQEAFYRFEERLRWYRRRADTDRPAARWTLRTVLCDRLRLLAPFVPYMANELHERLTGEPITGGGDVWPEPREGIESERLAVEEGLVEALADDVREVIDVTETDPNTIRVYTAAGWKREVFGVAADVGPDVGAIMDEAMSDPDLRERGDAVSDLAAAVAGTVRERPDDEVAVLRSVDEAAVYGTAIEFLEREFDADVVVYSEDDDPEDPGEKAGQAEPFRPAIHIE